jgi:hypothetical protein
MSANVGGSTFGTMEPSLAAQGPAAVAARPRPAPAQRGASRLVGSARELRTDRFGTLERAMRHEGDVVRFLVGPAGRRFEVYGVFHPGGVRSVLAGDRGRYSKGTRVFNELA